MGACPSPRARSWDSPGVGLAVPRTAPAGHRLDAFVSAAQPCSVLTRHQDQKRAWLSKGGTSRVGSEHQPWGPDTDWVCHPKGQIKIAWGVPCYECSVLCLPQPPAWTAPVTPAAFQSGQSLCPPGRKRGRLLPFLKFSWQRSGAKVTHAPASFSPLRSMRRDWLRVAG